eukprot:TRINITY_DN3327_c0_g2_i1.p1 TRINITY_DN3327_c0_g2~~TRINITY_DN3327_c0_g2_i1.p1  ORF type:complete len:215 (-),score=63.23 TRINITY_DN3327_c0_g2_i1:277-870(-)
MSCSGTVKSFRADKGFGFITDANGQDIFLHKKSCTDGGVPQQGDTVYFDMTESTAKPGTMQATNVTGGTGKPPQEGTVKMFNAEKGFGFITAQDGTDVFVHAKACTDGATPQQGDWVKFTIQPSPTKPGQMQASNVTGGTGWGGGGGKGGGGGFGAMKGGWDGGKGGGKSGPYGGGKGFGGGKGGGWEGGWEGGCGW